MNPKILVFLGFLGLSAAMLGIETVIPQTPLTIAPKILILALAILFDILAFASRYHTYLILPLVRQHKRHVIINSQTPYWLSTTGDCIIRKVGDEFIATVYINIPLYISSSEMTDEEKLSFTTQVSRLVGVSKEPVRFTTELYLMNKDEYIQKLKDNINVIENEQARLMEGKATEQELEHVKGKLSMWRKMLENISKNISYELGSFAAISGKGTKEFEAITVAQQKARDLMAGISATLGVPPNIVVGKDILKYVEPEYLVPYTTVAEEIEQNIEQQVV